jgi:hypothetical protein
LMIFGGGGGGNLDVQLRILDLRLNDHELLTVIATFDHDQASSKF